MELLEKWDNRLKFPFDRLPERYISANLSIHLHVEYSGHVNLPDGNTCLVYGHGAPEPGSFKTSARGTNNNCQFPVLISSIHVVNTPKRSIERFDTSVRLQTLDACQCRGSTDDALYLSAVTSRFVWVCGGID